MLRAILPWLYNCQRFGHIWTRWEPYVYFTRRHCRVCGQREVEELLLGGEMK